MHTSNTGTLIASAGGRDRRSDSGCCCAEELDRDFDDLVDEAGDDGVDGIGDFDFDFAFNLGEVEREVDEGELGFDATLELLDDDDDDGEDTLSLSLASV